MILRILLKPGSKLDKIEMIDDVLHIKVKARPVDGAANAYLIKYLAYFLHLPPSSITIIKGHTSKYKTLTIEGEEEKITAKIKEYFQKY